MYKLIPLDKEEYDNYITKLTNNTTYLNSYSWGEFSKVKRNCNVYYLGLINENDKLLCSTILFQKLLHFNYSYFYIPSGYIIDYNNKELLEIFTNKILEFIKNKNSIYLEISPNIIDNNKISNYLKELNFIKTNKIINNLYLLNNNNISNIKETITNKLKEYKNINIEYEITIGNKNNINDLYNLLKDNNLLKHDLDYYETMYEIFNGNKHSKITLIITKLNINKTIKDLEKKLKTVNNQISIIPIDNLNESSKNKLSNLKEKKNILIKDIDTYKTYRQDYGYDKIINIEELIIYNNKAYLISSINDKDINIEYINLNIYKETISYLESNNINHLYVNKKSNLLDKVNLIGTYRYINKKFIYKIYNLIHKKD